MSQGRSWFAPWKRSPAPERRRPAQRLTDRQVAIGFIPRPLLVHHARLPQEVSV